VGSFVLAGLIVSGAWTQLDAIGPAVWLLPALMLALDFTAPTLPGRLFQRPRFESTAAIIAAAALCTLHLLHVALTAREEFGFSGDEGYHLSATRAFALYFIKAGPYLAGAVAVFLLLRRFTPKIAASAATVALIASSYFLPDAALFGRYPTGFYLLSTPLNVALDVAHVPFPFTANHIVNMLSLPAWLFVLRPAIIGRWPDWRVLPVALLMYFQGASITFTSSGLLEPWPFAILLLALEAVVAVEPDRRWIAVLLAGAATCFKETAILFVPPIWMLAMVDWRGWRPVLRPHAITIGVTAIVPFVVYFAVRRGLHIARGYDVAGSAALWTVARAGIWLANARQLLGGGGSISVGLVVTWLVAGLVVHRQAWRHYAVWMLAAIAIAIFFAADVASIPFTGHGRFLAHSLLALCGAVFATTYWLFTVNRRLLIGVSVAIAALQVIPTARVFALDCKPDYERNSLESYRSLIRFPVRSLIARLADPAIARIRVVAFDMDLISLQVAYPDLARRYELRGESQSTAAPDCGCHSPSEATLAVFEWPAHFDDTGDARESFESMHAACVAQLRATCARVALEQRRGGAIVGAIGAGPR
jgi:hypothetical protein